MKLIKTTLIIAIIMAIQGCMNEHETVRQGRLTYNVVDVFEETPAIALARAGARGDAAEIKRQIAAGVDPNTVGKYDITPLWWAVWTQNLRGFKTLLESGANPNVRRPEFSIMILAAGTEDARFLELALKHGGDPNFRDVNPVRMPIFESMLMDSTRHRELLLQAGADINAQNEVGDTPMMKAIGTSADYKFVWECLQRGADYRIKTFNNKTLADSISTCHINPDDDRYLWREKVIEFLKSKGIEAHRPEGERPRGKP